MAITAVYAALLTGLLVILSARVIGHRRSRSIEIGDGDDRELLRRMRVHANFVEYVPFALVLMAVAESMSAPKALLHVLGVALLAGRVMHAYALSQTPHILRLRVLGMVLTLTMLMVAAAACLWLAVGRGGLL